MDAQLRTKSVDLQTFKDKTFGSLNLISSRREKKTALCDCIGKIKTKLLCGDFCEVIEDLTKS